MLGSKGDNTANQIYTFLSIECWPISNHDFPRIWMQSVNFTTFRTILNKLTICSVGSKIASTANPTRTFLSIECGPISRHYSPHIRLQFTDFHMMLNFLNNFHCLLSLKLGTTENPVHKFLSMEYEWIPSQYILHIGMRFSFFSHESEHFLTFLLFAWFKGR